MKTNNLDSTINIVLAYRRIAGRTAASAPVMAFRQFIMDTLMEEIQRRAAGAVAGTYTH